MLSNQQKMYKEIAKRTGMPVYKIMQAWSSQFKLVHRTMKEGKEEAVRLPRFGTFAFSQERKKFLDRLKHERETQQDR